MLDVQDELAVLVSKFCPIGIDLDIIDIFDSGTVWKASESKMCPMLKCTLRLKTREAATSPLLLTRAEGVIYDTEDLAIRGCLEFSKAVKLRCWAHYKSEYNRIKGAAGTVHNLRSSASSHRVEDYRLLFANVTRSSYRQSLLQFVTSSIFKSGLCYVNGMRCRVCKSRAQWIASGVFARSEVRSAK